MEFVPFSKIGRLSRDVIVTEKIDGTNAQIHILSEAELTPTLEPFVFSVGPGVVMLAGSRTRYIKPGDDNFGFAAWAAANAVELFKLGPGRHYGEWWGSGIQRGYGLPKGEKRFSLFNVSRWVPFGQTPGDKQDVLPACVGLVPTLYTGTFDSFMGHVDDILDQLRATGSWAAPGFMNPEGIVAFHIATGTLFKKTLEKDGEPKSAGKVAA